MDEDANNNDQDEILESDEELNSYDDEEEDDDEDFDDEDDEDAELDDISETELEEMAASTQRSLFMVQMQLANRRAAEEQATMDIDTVHDARHEIPHMQWQEFIHALTNSKVFKVPDSECHTQLEGDMRPQTLVHDLSAAIQSHAAGLTHVILGGNFLQCIPRQDQKRLFQALWTRHAATLTYLKLGSDDCPPHVIDVEGLVSVLHMSLLQPPHQLPEESPALHSPLHIPDKNNNNLHLTEMELRQMSISTPDQIASLVQVLSGASRLKQLNLLGIHIDTIQQGLLDPLLETVAQLPQLDECRLCCTAPSPVPLITSSCLAQVLAYKPKWWRLGLDGVGLDDSHCQVLAQAMSHEHCKAGDLLSLTKNPAVSTHGWNQLFDVLFQKQRMGLVKVDDASWQATFDLVRSMNNIHGRLQFLGESGSFASRVKWIEWLAKLSQISWEDEAHKANYIWFTLLERPDYVHC